MKKYVLLRNVALVLAVLMLGVLIWAILGPALQRLPRGYYVEAEEVARLQLDVAGFKHVWGCTRDGRTHNCWDMALAWSRDESLLATTTLYGNHDDASLVQVWDVTMGVEQSQLRWRVDAASETSLSPDGTLLATSTADGTLYLRDITTGQERIQLEPMQPVSAPVFSPDGRLLASAGVDGSVRLWDLATGEEHSTLPVHGGEVRQMAFSPDGTLIAVSSQDGTVCLWDVAAGTEQAVLEQGESGPGSAGWRGRILFNPDGSRLAVGWISSQFYDVVRVRDVATGELLSERAVGIGPANTAWAFNPDGELRVVYHLSDSWEYTVADGVTGRSLPPDVNAYSVALNPDGTLLASASGGFKPGEYFSGGGLYYADEVWLTDVESGARTIIFRDHATRVVNVWFSPAGRRLAFLTDTGLLRVVKVPGE